MAAVISATFGANIMILDCRLTDAQNDWLYLQIKQTRDESAHDSITLTGRNLPRRWETLLYSHVCTCVDGIPAIEHGADDHRAALQRIKWLNAQLADLLTSDQMIDLTIKYEDDYERTEQIACNRLIASWRKYLAIQHGPVPLPEWPTADLRSSPEFTAKHEQSLTLFNNLQQQLQAARKQVMDQLDQQHIEIMFSQVRVMMLQLIAADDQLQQAYNQAAALMSQIVRLDDYVRIKDMRFKDLDELIQYMVAGRREYFRFCFYHEHAKILLEHMNDLHVQLPRLVIYLQRTLIYLQQHKDLMRPGDTSDAEDDVPACDVSGDAISSMTVPGGV